MSEGGSEITCNGSSRWRRSLASRLKFGFPVGRLQAKVHGKGNDEGGGVANKKPLIEDA